jgi:nucleotide-binding universal stress UspA family protein
MTTPDMAGKPSAVSRILLPTDFSPPAEAALEWGRRMAEAFGAKLVLLHVVDILRSAQLGPPVVSVDPLLPILREEAKRHMEEWQARVEGAETVILEGPPRLLIVDSAIDLHCQMIVMGTHGRSGIAHLLLGSVAEYVVRHSKVPVLTIRG